MAWKSSSPEAVSPEPGREEIISRLTCESIAFAALNARCEGARYKGGPILDGALALEKRNKLSYIDRLLEQLFIYMNGGKPDVDALEPPTMEIELPVEGRGAE